MILVPDLKTIENTSRSRAEVAVAHLLGEIDGGPDAVAFHSVKLRSHAYKQEAEADFVVLWKNVVILLEVKGGGIRKHDGLWYSIDRRGDWHGIEAPMDQARSAMYALRGILRQGGAGWFAHEAVVVTPDVDAPPNSHEWNPSHWLAADDMTVSGLTTALDLLAAIDHTPPTGTRRAPMADIRTRLFGEFVRMPVIDAQRGAVVEEQNRATAGQARVLSALARNPRVMVLGGAGTGKSLVLAESARLEARQGRSVLLTFRSPELVRFFAPLVAGYDVDLIPFDDLGTDKAYDAVFVDEAQDVMYAEGMDKLDGFTKGGRTAGRWRMCLDPNNQAHIDGRFDEEVFELVAAEGLSVDLALNVRNTKAIVHMVQAYLGADVGDAGIVHGERVQWESPTGEADVGAAEAVAERLLDDGVRPEAVWIVSATSEAAPRRTAQGITVTSPKYAKGLEAEYVIVCDLPESFDALGNAAFYVAVTRARVALHIVASKQDRNRLEQLARERMEPR